MQTRVFGHMRISAQSAFANYVDPDHLASSEAKDWICIVCH